MRSRAWLSLGLCVLCQCAGTETGNPFQREQALLAFAPLSATVVRSGLGTVHFDRVTIEVASLALESCTGEAATELVAQRSFDLLAEVMEDVRIPPGTYCALLVGIGSGADSFAASRSVSQGVTRLTFDSRLRADVRLPLRKPWVARGEQPSWVLAVDLEPWLDAIDRWLNGNDAQLSPDDAETLALRRAQARSLRLYEQAELELGAPLSDVGVLQR